MDDEIAQYNNLGNVVDKSRLAVVNFEIASGKLKGLSADRANTLRAMASTADAEAEQLAGIKSIKTIEDKIKAVQAEANVQGVAKEATKEALLMKDLDTAKTHISSQEYDRLKVSIHDATQALEAHGAKNAISGMERGTGDKIAKIREESDAVGQSALAHKELAAALAIEAQAGKAIQQYPDQAAAINASAKKQIDDITAALIEADKAQASWDRGVQTAMQDYLNSAGTAATQSKNLFTTAFKGMEDALVNFAMTGKLSFSSLAKSIVSDLIRIQVQAQESRIVGSLFGATGMFGSNAGVASSQGLSMSDIAGAFAGGGDPPLNVPSLVGEKGPELFVPRGAGTIVPNKMLGGGSGGAAVSIVQHITIDSRTDASTIRDMLTQSMQATKASISEAIKRGSNQYTRA